MIILFRWSGHWAVAAAAAASAAAASSAGRAAGWRRRPRQVLVRGVERRLSGGEGEFKRSAAYGFRYREVGRRGPRRIKFRQQQRTHGQSLRDGAP
ncbi:hypothetical protein NL676_036174 [Syzygium grande]|nr:hypothetical protein NL676_036174 [Syzygium grande]